MSRAGACAPPAQAVSGAGTYCRTQVPRRSRRGSTSGAVRRAVGRSALSSEPKISAPSRSRRRAASCRRDRARAAARPRAVHRSREGEHPVEPRKHGRPRASYRGRIPPCRCRVRKRCPRPSSSAQCAVVVDLAVETRTRAPPRAHHRLAARPAKGPGSRGACARARSPVRPTWPHRRGRGGATRRKTAIRASGPDLAAEHPRDPAHRRQPRVAAAGRSALERSQADGVGCVELAGDALERRTRATRARAPARSRRSVRGEDDDAVLGARHLVGERTECSACSPSVNLGTCGSWKLTTAPAAASRSRT